MRSPFASIEHVRTRLPNGLTAIAVRLASVHTAAVVARLRVGPRYESARDNGISHFLEHMLYRGTPRHPSAHDQALAFEALGSSLGAATYVDLGSMSVATPPENLESALALLGEVYCGPIFEGLEIERGIVEEEILDLCDDEGTAIDADVLVRGLSFGDHPLGMPITGTIEQVRRFDQRSLRSHHGRHYVGPGTVVAAAGPFDPERVVERIAQAFGALERGALLEVAPPPAQREPRIAYREHADSKTALKLAFRAPGDHHPDEPAAELLLRVLDDGMSTRLYERICDQRGLCYDVSAGYEAYSDAGLFDVAAETAHERAELVLAELLDVLRELRESGPTDRELDKSKTRLRWHLTEMLDRPAEVADFFALGALTGGAATPLARYEELEAVSRSEARDVAARLFVGSGFSAVAVGEQPPRGRRALRRAVQGF